MSAPENCDAVIGVDAGGTSTRCVVAGMDGTVLGRGTGAGANQFSSPDPAAALGAALSEALAVARERAGAPAIVGSVFGVAGASAAGHARALELAAGAWSAAGLDGAPHVTDDIAVAFAAGSAEDEGAVLIAGTGAVAARVRAGAVVRRCDGYGWLLGDEGSAVWIALAGLRAAVSAIDGKGAPTALTSRFAAALEIDEDPQEFIRTVYARRPAELGALAPEVSAAAVGGDAAAQAVCDEAADRLLASLDAACPAPAGAGPSSPGGPRNPSAPVVLAGAVLDRGPVADRVRAGVRARRGTDPVPAGDGALGAAGLALRAAGAPASAHRALLSTDG